MQKIPPTPLNPGLFFQLRLLVCGTLFLIYLLESFIYEIGVIEEICPPFKLRMSPSSCSF